MDLYLRRKYIGDEWPGVVTEDMLQESRRGKLWSNDWIYGYDPDILAREAILAGFRVKKCSFYGMLATTGSLSRFDVWTTWKWPL